MVYRLDTYGLPRETQFKRGDFNKISSLYNEMMLHNIARDCAPVTAENTLIFRIYKSAKDKAYLYEISIFRDDYNKRFVYEVKTASGQQIARDSKLDNIIEKVKWYMGKQHHIQAWKKPRHTLSEPE